LDQETEWAQIPTLFDIEGYPMKLLQRVPVALCFLSAVSAFLLRSPTAPVRVERRNVAAPLLLDAGSKQGVHDKVPPKHPFLEHHAVGCLARFDLTTAFLMVTTSESLFTTAALGTATKKKNEKQFTDIITHRLAQVASIPWTRFGVFLPTLNSTTLKVRPGMANSCSANKKSVIECKIVKHKLNTTGILQHEALLQVSGRKAPPQLTFEIVIEPASMEKGDCDTAEEVAKNLVKASVDFDNGYTRPGQKPLMQRFHMLLPGTFATLGTTAFHDNEGNSITMGMNPSGHWNGPLADASVVKDLTSMDISKVAEAINLDTLTRLKDLDGALQRSALAHFDALRFTPYRPPDVTPSGPLMLPHPGSGYNSNPVPP